MKEDLYNKLCCRSMEQCLEFPIADRQGLVELDARDLGGHRLLYYRHPMAGPFTRNAAQKVERCPFCGKFLDTDSSARRADWRDVARS